MNDGALALDEEVRVVSCRPTLSLTGDDRSHFVLVGKSRYSMRPCGTARQYLMQENGRKSEKTGLNKSSKMRHQPVDIEEKSSDVNRFRFSVAPMME